MDLEEIWWENQDWFNFNHTGLLTTQVAYTAGNFLDYWLLNRVHAFVEKQMNSKSDDEW
jgi:hypothetical protein